MVQELERIYNSPSSIPPSNIDAEESILGGILLDSEALSRVIDILPAEAFCVKVHQEIYRTMLRLHNSGKPTDLITLSNYLNDKNKLEKIGGNIKLAHLIDRTVSTVNIDRYAELVKEKWLRRKAIFLGHHISEIAADPAYFLGNEDGNPVASLINRIENLTKDLTESLASDENKEYQKYSACMEEFRQIELDCEPGFREWKLGGLAAKYSKNPKFLREVYYKSLIAKECEPSMDFDQLLEKYGQDIREWFLHGLMPKGTTILLHALGGTGKTQTAYHLMYHLATGTDWGDFRVSKSQRKCLIVQTDESANDMIANLKSRGFGPGMPIRYMTRWTADHIQALRKEVEEFKPEIVLIDSLTTINRNSMFSENDSEYARPVLLLRDIAQEYGCTFLIIHHSSKEGSARGTTAIYNSVSEVWKLGRVKDNSSPDAIDRTFTIEKSRSRRPAAYRFEYNPDDHSWECRGEERHLDNPPPSLKTKDMILSKLSYNRGIPYCAEELESVIGGTRSYISRCCSELYFDGLISRKPLGGRGGGYSYFVGNDNENRVWLNFTEVDTIDTDLLPNTSTPEPVTKKVINQDNDTATVSAELLRSDQKNNKKNDDESEVFLNTGEKFAGESLEVLPEGDLFFTHSTSELCSSSEKEAEICEDFVTENEGVYPQNAYEFLKSDLAKKYLEGNQTTRVLGKNEKFKLANEVCHSLHGYAVVTDVSKDKIRVTWENGEESDWLLAWLFEKVEEIKFAKGISFKHTTPALLAGKKSVTRRDWKPSTAATYIKYFQEETKVPAYDKSPRNGGKVIGFLTLTKEPFKQPLFEMTQGDLEKEGFGDMKMEEFHQEFFGDITKQMWVVEFMFEAI
jgi:KaiC/GvpD/RAD55 family RecA-like ATPase